MKKVFLSALWLVLAFGSFAFAGEGWISNFEEAKQKAKSSGKDILVDFTGSDWCIWCKRLKQEVFEQEKFKTEAPKKFILLEIDMPSQNHPMKQEQRDYNRKLVTEFNVQGYPTILLMDSEGRPYGKTGYQKGGADKYMEHLAELMKTRESRDAFIKESDAAADNAAKAQALEKAMDVLRKAGVEGHYVELQEKIIHLDSDNKLGLMSKYASSLAKFFYAKKDLTKYQTYLDMVKKIDPQGATNLDVEVAIIQIETKYFKRRSRPSDDELKEASKSLQALLEKKPNGEAAQKVCFYAGALEYQMGAKEKGLELLEKALQYAPDSQMGKRIQTILSRLKQQK